MIECAFCDEAATQRDRDMDLWLCPQHHAEMNGQVFIPELDEVW